MIRSPETTTLFVREMVLLREMADRHMAAIQVAHDDYDRRFALMQEQLRNMARERQREVCKILIRLGGADCPSGSLDYHNAEARLVSMGITSPGGIYEHDRQLIAELMA